MIPGVPRRKETTGWMVVLGVILFLFFLPIAPIASEFEPFKESEHGLETQTRTLAHVKTF